MGWDENNWALLVQSKFEGMAREVYVNLSEREASDYEAVKEAVLGSNPSMSECVPGKVPLDNKTPR